MEHKGILEQLEARVAELEKRLAMLERHPEIPEGGTKAESTLAGIVSRYAWALDKTQTANILGVTRVTVYAMTRDGRLKELPDGKIPAKSVADYLDGNGGAFVPFRRGKKRREASRA